MAFTERILVLLLRKSSGLTRPLSCLDHSNEQRHKALAIVNLITPKTTIASPNSRHNHLIEGILRLPQPSEKPTTSSDPFQWRSETLNIDAADLSCSLSSYSSTRNLRSGIIHHCIAIKLGLSANIYVGTSLVGFYCNCNELSHALLAFDEMPAKNTVTWTTIIAGFAQERRITLCLTLFHRMRISNSTPNGFTFSSLLSACSGNGALAHGQSIHSQTIKTGFFSHLFVSNAIVSMYCKCGALEDANCVFSASSNRDTATWNSMISGFAQHGLAELALRTFHEMEKLDVRPDAVTFLAVLSSCRHAGLVDEGRKYFRSMVDRGVEPEMGHYSSVVDLLGRAGLLTEARGVIASMPVAPNAVVWGSMLSSSRLHGNLGLGVEAAECQLALDPGCGATYLQLAKLYAASGRWDRAAEMRKLMRDRGLKVFPGRSWIEIKNVVHGFGAEDRSKVERVDIAFLLDSLSDHMSSLGHDDDVEVF